MRPRFPVPHMLSGFWTQMFGKQAARHGVHNIDCDTPEDQSGQLLAHGMNPALTVSERVEAEEPPIDDFDTPAVGVNAILSQQEDRRGSD